MITCDQCREDMAEFALGDCAPEGRAAMNAHLSTCVVCRRELAEVESAWAALSLTCERTAPSEDLLDRILQQIDRQVGPRPAIAPAVAAPLTRRQRLFSYAMAASLLFALVAGALTWGGRPAGGPTGDLLADRALHDLAQRLGKLQELEQMLNMGGVRLASLRAPATDGKATAYVVWDATARQCHFFVSDLAPAPAGKAYQLWAFGEGRQPLAGPTFVVNEAGLGSVLMDFPGVAAQVKPQVMVTLEPQGGSTSPSGVTVLEASL